MSKKLLFFSLIAVCALGASLAALPPASKPQGSVATGTRVYDTDTYINANNLLGFVTNAGELFTDKDLLFGQPYGLYYPFTSVSDILSGSIDRTIMYGAGLWLGGRVSGATRIAMAEYNTEYTPGLMVGTSYAPDALTNPAYRVYKLYADSLEANPNQDYLNWPVGQGAPVDHAGRPLALGDQTLFTVYNDADASAHTNNAGSTEPLKIEVRQTVWANEASGSDTAIIPSIYLGVPTRSTTSTVTALVMDPHIITGNDYLVEIREDAVMGNVWKLVNKTTGATLLDNQTNFSGDDNYSVVEGLKVKVTGTAIGFKTFATIANGNGSLDPALAAAFAFQGFPTPGSSNPTYTMQVTGQQWAIHTADNGGTGGGGTLGSYAAFVSRVSRDGTRWAEIGKHDYEMRFTGSPSNPGVNGSYAYEAFNDGNTFWVPFELWDIGEGTQGDPADDYQIVPWVNDDGNDNSFALESWGDTINGGGDLEHSASSGINDPYTDWVYWMRPTNTSPGTAGYDAAEAQMLAHTYTGENEHEVIARMVMVAWNAGVAPPFYAPDSSPLQCPEQGTILRIETYKGFPVPETLAFTAATPQVIVTGSEGNCTYMQYDLHNKGGNDITDLYVSMWADPDLGGALDDLAGCDTMAGVFYTYNATNADLSYGARPPAVGVRLVQGPIVQSPGDTAIAYGQILPNHRNISVTAFTKYINGTDPNSPAETYGYMQGLNKGPTGMEPYRYPAVIGPVTTFQKSGDPVTGTGDVDSNPADRRMMASIGPFNMAPGDSQQVIVKWGVGQGTDRLNSITRLKQTLASAVNLQFSQTQLTFHSDSSEVPPAQSIVITNTAGGTQYWRAQHTQPWLSFVRSMGTGNPDTLQVFPNDVPSPGTYYDTIVVIGLDNIDGPMLIPVTYTVTGVSCCVGTTGNIDGIGIVNLSDLSVLIAYLTVSPRPTLQCPEEANVNATSVIDISDLSLLIAYLTSTPTPALPACPAPVISIPAGATKTTDSAKLQEQ